MLGRFVIPVVAMPNVVKKIGIRRRLVITATAASSIITAATAAAPLNGITVSPIPSQ